MNETYVTIRGRLVADPTARTTRLGAPMTTFRIAQTSRRQVQGQPGQWEDTEPSFYEVIAYRSLAANIAVSLRKGHPVTVHGKQRIVSWRREDGTTWWDVKIDADAVGHDLTFGTAAYSRVGLGRAPEEWTVGAAPGSESPLLESEAGEPTEPPGFPGDPERDAYVVEPGPGRGLGEVGSGPAADRVDPDGGVAVDEPPAAPADTGPLVRPRKGAAA
jgi:single-strand DNA-binding protein